MREERAGSGVMKPLQSEDGRSRDDPLADLLPSDRGNIRVGVIVVANANDLSRGRIERVETQNFAAKRTPGSTRDPLAEKHGGDGVGTCEVLAQLDAVVSHGCVELALEFADSLEPTPNARKGKNRRRSGHNPLDAIGERA